MFFPSFDFFLHFSLLSRPRRRYYFYFHFQSQNHRCKKVLSLSFFYIIIIQYRGGFCNNFYFHLRATVVTSSATFSFTHSWCDTMPYDNEEVNKHKKKSLWRELSDWILKRILLSECVIMKTSFVFITRHIWPHINVNCQ